MIPFVYNKGPSHAPFSVLSTSKGRSGIHSVGNRDQLEKTEKTVEHMTRTRTIRGVLVRQFRGDSGCHPDDVRSQALQTLGAGEENFVAGMDSPELDPPHPAGRNLVTPSIGYEIRREQVTSFCIKEGILQLGCFCLLMCTFTLIV